MNLKRMLAIIAVLLLSWSTVCSADFFAPEETESTVEDAQNTQPQKLSSPPVPTPYPSPLYSTGAGIEQALSGRKGSFHPFLSIGGYYTDNLFNTRNDEESDWVSVVSPGFWVALPASHQQMMQVTTENSAPGGLEVSRFRDNVGRKFQAYALYRAEINELSDNSDQNHVNQRGEALLRYNRNRLSFELLDVYQVDHDDYNTGDAGPGRLDKFHSNLLNTSVTFRLSPKFSLQGEYSHFMLDYNDPGNGDDDRKDNVYSIYTFYRLSEKLTTFLQYEHVNTEYDVDIRSDYNEDNFYGGFKWDVTAKTKGRIKLGYGEKDYDDSSIDNTDEFLIELRTDYRITPKTSIYLRALRKDYAANVSGTSNILTHRFYLGYSQRIRAKLHARARLEYRLDDYDGGVAPQPEDDYYGFRFELGYTLQRWLNVSVGYAYRQRESNLSERDYTTNSVFIYLTAAL